jgi:uncharacterized SAM-binding protein YcdF (DUF218 family)
MAKGKGENYNRKKIVINLTIILFVCLSIIIEVNIVYWGFKHKPQKADVIVVLGCAVWGQEPSPALKERIDKASELYQKGYAERIIASGGRGYGEELSEAATIKKMLVKRGIPKKNIIEENNSTNTVENLKFSKQIMKKQNFDTAIIVTNYFHMYRASMITHDLSMTASFAKAPMPKSPAYIITSNIREVLSLVKYFTLQIFRLKGFLYIGLIHMLFLNC